MCSMGEKESNLFVKKYGIPSNMSFTLYLLVNLLFFTSPIHILIICAYWMVTLLYILYQYRKKDKATHDQSNKGLHFILYVNT